ncbi:hypothetical protein IHE45_20G025600 [Dioscorea alata]|uniref:Uncharacterized protein n=1 Tax=Dioscorea alata TaxID=55571 RepID=A0ACB7TRF4_DIOAL|nr:hypothetical protein IHE45_20G025600 [Dioscorea alata]
MHYHHHNYSIILIFVTLFLLLQQPWMCPKCRAASLRTPPPLGILQDLQNHRLIGSRPVPFEDVKLSHLP